MGLMDEVRDESYPPRRNKMDEIREKLSGQDLLDFLEALMDPRISQASLIHALRRRDVHISGGTMSAMRRQYVNEHRKQN
jgi:hypothetical protein